jgi:hypothetical protein
MAIFQKKSIWIAGIFFVISFVSLFFIRIDLYGTLFSGHKSLSTEAVAALPESDTWMNIFQNDNKIGFSHKSFSREENGYRIQETVFMRINTMGLIQDIHLRTIGKLNTDFSLSTFDFNIKSGRFRFAVQGSVEDDTLSIKTQSAGDSRNFNLKVKKKPYLVAGILDAIRANELEPGDKFRFDIFDPSTMGQRPLEISVINQEDTRVMGFTKRATKLMLNFKGAKQFAWIGEDGELLKETGLLGMRLEKTTAKAARRGFAKDSGDDLTLIASVDANAVIEDTSRLKKLQIEISGIDTKNVYLHGGRQTLNDNILTIDLENLSDLPGTLARENLETLEKIFLNPSPFIQSDNEKIITLAREIIGNDTDTVLAKAHKLLNWVHENIEKRPVLSLPDALSTLNNRVGDCNEHAVLLAALARAVGIPARVEAGLVYTKGRFYYHAWNLLYLGKWITADALFGQMPSDVTHIRFTTGTQQQLDLMGIIGRVKLKVIDSEPIG